LFHLQLYANSNLHVFYDEQILRYAPASSEIKDRTFIFPIYSGMFFLLKYGALCDPSEQVATELDLVGKFVKETERHGDPVHYGRALAMQGETCHRLGKFEEAVESHLKLKEIYNIDEHSGRIIAAYASDRCAQNYGFTANCYVQLGQVDKALEICDYIEYHIMPKMDPKNVHNSMCNVMQSLWIWRDNGMAERSLSVFRRFVLEPFDEYFGKDGSTPHLPLFRPIEILMTLTLLLEGKVEVLDESVFDYAFDISNVETSVKMETALGSFCRGPMSVGAEICLILYKLTEDPDKKKILLDNGVRLANIGISVCDGSGSDGAPKFATGYMQLEAVHRELNALHNDQHDFGS
jgi:tetratricopeptide (TPR) repeat protein